MLQQVIAGFYSKLSGDATLQTKLGGSASDKKIFNLIAPQGETLPYITFGVLTDMPIGVFGSLAKIEDLTFWVNCFSSTGQKECQEIVDLVMTVLDDATLTVTGYTNMKTMREFVGSLLYDIETKIFQIPIRIRVQLTK